MEDEMIKLTELIGEMDLKPENEKKLEDVMNEINEVNLK